MPRAVALALCGIGTLLVLVGLRLSRLGREARGYTRAPGRVIASRVEEIPQPGEQGGTQYRPVVRYAFEARGHTFESERVFLGGSPGLETSDPQEARRVVERYPAGGAVDVWFDPADPRRSVLDRSAPRAAVFAAVAIGLAMLGAGIFALAR